MKSCLLDEWKRVQRYGKEWRLAGNVLMGKRLGDGREEKLREQRRERDDTGRRKREGKGITIKERRNEKRKSR